MMGTYCVRFKGFPIKSTSKKQPVDDEEEVVEVEGSEKKPKKKGKEPFAPEKAVVKNVFGVRNAKKEMIILDEKGSAKSGNYGHAGRAGKLGGSAPKAKGPVSGGAAIAPQDKPLTDDEVSELGREWTNVHVENLNEEFSKRGISNDNVDWDGVLMTVDGSIDHKSGQRGMMSAQNKLNAAAAKAGFTVADSYSDGFTMSFTMEKKYPGHDAAMKDVGWDKPAPVATPAKPARQVLNDMQQRKVDQAMDRRAAMKPKVGTVPAIPTKKVGSEYTGPSAAEGRATGTISTSLQKPAGHEDQSKFSGKVGSSWVPAKPAAKAPVDAKVQKQLDTLLGKSGATPKDLDTKIAEIKSGIRDMQDRKIPRGPAYDFQRDVRNQYLSRNRSMLAAMERQKTKLGS
jgi:hypothetical protein